MRLIGIYSISTLLIVLSYQVAICQEWKKGILKLSSKEQPIEGEFKIQYFVNITSVSQLKRNGGQNTFSSQEVEWIKLEETENRINLYETFSFTPSKGTVEPKILLQVLYSSDSVKLLSGDIRSIQKFYEVMPLPGLGILFFWGKKATSEKAILISLGGLQNLTVINNLKVEKDYGIRIDKKLILKQLMNEYQADIKNFVKGNNLNWQRNKDLIRIVKYYDQLKYNSI